MPSDDEVIRIIARMREELTSGIGSASAGLSGFSKSVTDLGTNMQVAGARMMGIGGIVTAFISSASKAALEFGNASRALTGGAEPKQDDKTTDEG